MLRKPGAVLAWRLSGVFFKKRGKVVGRIKGKDVRDFRNGKTFLKELFGACYLDIVDKGARCNPGLFLKFRFKA